MHLYIWLLVLASQSGGLLLLYSDGREGGRERGKNKHRNSTEENMTPLLCLSCVTDPPPCFSPSEDECWPGDQARRPYLAAKEPSPPPSQPPSAPQQQKPPKYQPVPSNYSTGGRMVSRRAIISRSRDDLQHHLGVNNKNFTGEDQWFSKEKLYKVFLLKLFGFFLTKLKMNSQFPSCVPQSHLTKMHCFESFYSVFMR